MTIKERQEVAQREIDALDAIENLLEYAKKDILRPVFLDTLEDFQAELIQYRALCYDSDNDGS